MGIVNVVSEVKKVHQKELILISIGKFFYAYGKDAYILSYIFEYKLMKIEQENVYSCAFPKQSYPKVTAKLENLKINYIILDRRNNYNVDEKSHNRNLNNCQKYFGKARLTINKKIRIERINKYLLNNLENEQIYTILKNVEEVINGKRKIQNN